MALLWGKPCNKSKAGPLPPTKQAISMGPSSDGTLRRICSKPGNVKAIIDAILI
jgi:hypothetical protein